MVLWQNLGLKLLIHQIELEPTGLEAANTFFLLLYIPTTLVKNS